MATFNGVFSNNATLSRSQFTPRRFSLHPSQSYSRPCSLSSFKSFHFPRRKLVTENGKPWRHPVAYVHASAKGFAATDGNNANKGTTLSIGIIGASGNIGRELLEQLRDQAPVLKEKRNIDLRVTGLTNTKIMLLSDSGFDLSTLVPSEELKPETTEQGQNADLQKFVECIHGNQDFPNKVLIDCTANEKFEIPAGEKMDIATHYYNWMRKGIHIITPNKKANSGPLDKYLKLRDLQRQSYAHYFYETTVGAGLPIISTLKGLLETGDKIKRIESVFSGTLSYIFNNLKDGRGFEELVEEAKEKGFTEPDPNDDLEGEDVARKVLILARECGLQLELNDITIESLVPSKQKEGKTVKDKLDDAAKNNKVLRYVGILDMIDEKGSAELRAYEKDDPISLLKGTDNMIKFVTDRYGGDGANEPLIVQGPGAGVIVTAGGVFNDIIHLASYLGAPS